MSPIAHDHSAQPRSLAMLWLGLIGPPVVWLTQFELKYILAGGNESRFRSLALVASSIVALALVAMLGISSWRERRIAAESPLDTAAGVVGRNRFFATTGVMSATLFFLLIVAQTAAEFFIAPGHT